FPRIHFWLSYACCDLSSWALILVSSARLASILRPMSRFVTNRRAYAAILLVCALALCSNLPIFFMYGNKHIASRGVTKHCVIAHSSYRYFIVYVWTWIVLFKFAVVPGTILLGLNIVLITHVYRSKRIIQDMQRGSFTNNGASAAGRSNSRGGGSGQGKSSADQSQHAVSARAAQKVNQKAKSHQHHNKNKKQKGGGKRSSSSMFPRSSARPKNLTRTLLVINSVFLLCNIPIVIYMTGKTYFFPGGYDDRQNLFNTCANFTMYTNNALNFLLYCLTGTRFRHQLRAMFVDVGSVVRGSIKRPLRRAYV
ncbi:hypothetical protein EGW08_005709, partial [Elysia chlorotica]